jgi:hypothetical protein
LGPDTTSNFRDFAMHPKPVPRDLNGKNQNLKRYSPTDSEYVIPIEEEKTNSESKSMRSTRRGGIKGTKMGFHTRA